MHDATSPKRAPQPCRPALHENDAVRTEPPVYVRNPRRSTIRCSAATVREAAPSAT